MHRPLDGELELAAALRDAIVEGTKHLHDGALGDAAQSFQRALTLAEAAFGSDAEEVIEPLLGLADAEVRSKPGDAPAAAHSLSLELRALAVGRTRFPPRDPRLVGILDSAALHLRTVGRFFEAAELAAEAASLITESPLAPAVRVRWVLRNTCGALMELGRYEDALPHTEWLVDHAPEPPKSSGLLEHFLMGRCLMGLNRPSEAQRVFERAIEIRTSASAGGTLRDNVASNELLSWLAESRRRSG